MKESRKCDSLKSAYAIKSNLLDSLLSKNLAMLDKLEANNAEREKFQDQLKKANGQLLKASKKNNWHLPLIIGVAAGALIASSL